MNFIFVYILDVALYSLFIVLAVMFIRCVFRKASKSVLCGLWLLVGLRLVLFVPVESDYSVLPHFFVNSILNEKNVNQDNIMSFSEKSESESEEGDQNEGLKSDHNKAKTENVIPNKHSNEFERLGEVYSDLSEKNESPDDYFRNVDSFRSSQDKIIDVDSTETNIYFILAWIWISGVFLMLLSGIVRIIKLKRRLRSAVRMNGERNVFLTEFTKSAFVFGLVKPRIFIAFSLTDDQSENILLHEKMHIRRRDHIFKFLSYILLSVYWFVPWIWVAYYIYGRDVELACDESVIRNLDPVKKAGYADTLLKCSLNRYPKKVGIVSFGESDVEKRIKNIAEYKKSSSVLSCISIFTAFACLFLFVTPVCEVHSSEENSYKMLDKNDGDYLSDNQDGIRKINYNETIINKINLNSDVVIGLAEDYKCPIDFEKLSKETGLWIGTYHEFADENNSSYVQLARKLLNGDDEVDIYILNMAVPDSRVALSRNMVYSLSESEILRYENNKMFDSIAHAFINDDGNIWGIPIGTNLNVLVTFPQNLEREGLSSDMFTDYYTFINILKSLEPEKREYFAIWGTDFGFDLLSNYIANNKAPVFESDMFRAYFESVWSGWRMYDRFEGNNPLFAGSSASNKIIDENSLKATLRGERTCVFMTEEKNVLKYSALKENTKIYSLPFLSSDYKPNIDVSMVAVVNPNGKHIDSAIKVLEYMAANNRETGLNGVIYKDLNDYPLNTDFESDAFKAIYEINCNAIVGISNMSLYDLHNVVLRFQDGVVNLDTTLRFMQLRNTGQ